MIKTTHQNTHNISSTSGFCLTDYKVEDLVPHSSPMVLIDSISQYDNESLSAIISINEKSKFYQKQLGGVPSWVGIEYMSQAIAAFSGIHSKIANKAVKLGFLLGSRKYHILQKVFKKDHQYVIFVQKLYQDGSGLACFDCTIFEQCDEGDNILFVQSKINVFETPE